MILDEFALFVFLILMIVTFVITLGTYLSIISEDMKKTDEEKMLKEKEKKEYIRSCKKGRGNKWKK